MPIAYVLLNCSLGSEEKVLEELKQIESVKEVSGTFGAYDILAKLQASNIEDLRTSLENAIEEVVINYRNISIANNITDIENKISRIENIFKYMTLILIGVFVLSLLRLLHIFLFFTKPTPLYTCEAHLTV